MTKRQQKLSLILIAVSALGLATWLVLRSLNSNIAFFYTPTQVVNNEAPQNKSFRLGGMVINGSLKREPKTLTVTFDVTDSAKTVPVTYTGLLPDLFKEGKGVVAQGKFGENGQFVASEVLAKHDENYMPPEAAAAMAAAKDAKKAKPQ
jgi:cytochrome c-type biogenesis protein CcmE